MAHESTAVSSAFESCVAIIIIIVIIIVRYTEYLHTARINTTAYIVRPAPQTTRTRTSVVPLPAPPSCCKPPSCCICSRDCPKQPVSQPPISFYSGQSTCTCWPGGFGAGIPACILQSYRWVDSHLRDPGPEELESQHSKAANLPTASRTVSHNGYLQVDAGVQHSRRWAHRTIATTRRSR